MVVNNAITRLTEIGFSEYEAKAYTALVGTNPATAYEIAKLSGIPTSKVYEVLAKLQERGVASVIEKEGKKRYLPLAPDEFVESRRSRLETTLDRLKRDLSSLNRQTDVSYIWNLHGYEYLQDKVERMIGSATRSILISTWAEELGKIKELLQEREADGVQVAVVHFGEPKDKVGQFFRHPIEQTLQAEKGGRGFTIVVDSREALIATVYDNKKTEGAWSLNCGFVILAEDYIKHDIYLMKIIDRFDGLLIERFGEGYKKLRDIFADEEVKP